MAAKLTESDTEGEVQSLGCDFHDRARVNLVDADGGEGIGCASDVARKQA